MKRSIRDVIARPQPTAKDAAYCRMTNRLGAALLIFLALFSTLSVLTSPIVLWANNVLPHEVAYTVEDLLGSLRYFVSFATPVVLFRFLAKKEDRVPIKLTPVLPRHTPLLLLAGIAVIHCTAIINSWISDLLLYSEFSSEVLWDTSTLTDYQGILMFIGTAIVPAFCEELLFRGLVLGNLLPYGKTSAILSSALLFGLMHQNLGQMLYATMAGVVLGIIYVETRSIWASTLMHFLNNLSSVINSILWDRLDTVSANRVIALLELVLIGGGMVALIVLIRRRERTKQAGESSSEGQENESCVSPHYRIRGFFSPLMTAFVAITVVEMIMLWMLALSYGG
ncbi:MAG: CPBP family intramembrane metalloprotease [Clostridia bacterium]|nr:CPBP family intramembrane metalloprotease [Clostridia bacterium]